MEPIDENPSRCSGSCCLCFYLAWSPTELAEKAEQHRLYLREHPGSQCAKEFVQIAGMVEHLAYRWTDLPDELRELVPPPRMDALAMDANYYTCKNFDRETRNCKIYDLRPLMCSQYPVYGNPHAICKYKGCTMRGNCGVDTSGIKPENTVTDSDIVPKDGIDVITF